MQQPPPPPKHNPFSRSPSSANFNIASGTPSNSGGGANDSWASALDLMQQSLSNHQTNSSSITLPSAASLNSTHSAGGAFLKLEQAWKETHSAYLQHKGVGTVGVAGGINAVASAANLTSLGASGGSTLGAGGGGLGAISKPSSASSSNLYRCDQIKRFLCTNPTRFGDELY